MGELAIIVKARRVELGLSQIELGEKLRLSDGRSYISRIERGHLIPSRERLDAMEKALNLPAGALQVAALSDEQGRKVPA